MFSNDPPPPKKNPSNDYKHKINITQRLVCVSLMLLSPNVDVY